VFEDQELRPWRGADDVGGDADSQFGSDHVSGVPS
jgi:hypothetical protein